MNAWLKNRRESVQITEKKNLKKKERECLTRVMINKIHFNRLLIKATSHWAIIIY